MHISIPELSLVVLIGASGSGKSTFARRHFKRTEIVSSDECRALVSDDENNQDATGDAFDVLHYIAEKRLRRGLLTVIDATNVQGFGRKSLLSMARHHHVAPVALVFDLPDEILNERLRLRTDRHFGDYVLRNHQRDLHESIPVLETEGFQSVYLMHSPEEMDSVTITRMPLPNNRKSETGPFDIIGDIHGCFDELTELLVKLNYQLEPDEKGMRVTPPRGRKLIFLGDLVDRGPASPAVLRLVMRLVDEGKALCIPGNHDDKLLRALRGRNVTVSHGLTETLAQLSKEPPGFTGQVRRFLDKLVDHYVLDGGRLVVAHGGLKESLQGRRSGAVRSFCLYGDTTGKVDELGLPIRRNWAAEYRGGAMVVYGHTPVSEPVWVNNTINIDTGCVFGGKLTALRYPEGELLSVEAHAVYYQPARPF